MVSAGEFVSLGRLFLYGSQVLRFGRFGLNLSPGAGFMRSMDLHNLGCVGLRLALRVVICCDLDSTWHPPCPSIGITYTVHSFKIKSAAGCLGCLQIIQTPRILTTRRNLSTDAQRPGRLLNPACYPAFPLSLSEHDDKVLHVDPFALTTVVFPCEVAASVFACADC